jgi:DNA end-binding protein Ku
MRSVWKGSISFGLVNIPVAVYPATREQKVVFRQLRKSDLSPIRYQKVAEADVNEGTSTTGAGSRGGAVAMEEAAAQAEEIVKGYEYEKGKYVVVTEEDFERVKIESTHTIEISDFVEQAQINLKYFYKPYYLEAQKGGEKGYSLLHRALVETGKLGVAKVAIRSKEYLAAVKPDGLFLVLELMHFAQEVLEPEGLRPAAEEVPARELEMAKKLIEAMAADWQPEKYTNSYQLALQALVEEKVQNRPVTKVAAPRREMVGDILAILQASLSKAGERKKAPAKGGGTRGRSTAALVKGKRRLRVEG